MQEAELTVEPDADDRAPGGAVTTELCGSIDPEPPCPLAPHHTPVERRGDALAVRVLFACESDDEARVRSRIDDALGRGAYVGPDGLTTHWRLVASHVGEVRDDEVELAARLVIS